MRARIGYVCPPPLPLQERGEAWAERPTATSFVCSSRCSAFALDMYIYIKTLNQTSRTVSTTLPAQAQPPFARHVIAIEHFIYPYLVKVVYMNLEKKKNPYFPPLFKSESGSKLWVIFLVFCFVFLFSFLLREFLPRSTNTTSWRSPSSANLDSQFISFSN